MTFRRWFKGNYFYLSDEIRFSNRFYDHVFAHNNPSGGADLALHVYQASLGYLGSLIFFPFM